LLWEGDLQTSTNENKFDEDKHFFLLQGNYIILYKNIPNGVSSTSGAQAG
jgi:hypothetical protein